MKRHSTTTTTTTTRNKKKAKKSIYYKNNNTTTTTTTTTSSSLPSIQIITEPKLNYNYSNNTTTTTTTRFTRSLIPTTTQQQQQQQYAKKPSMFGIHDKTNAIKLKLERLKSIANSWNKPPIYSFSSVINSNSPIIDLNPLKNTLIEKLSKEIPVNEFRNRIKDINRADNEARLRRAQRRNQKIPSFSFTDTITRTSDASLDTPRPPEPCLPTYQQIRDRQKLLDLTFGKRKIRKRNWRKSLDLDKLNLVEKTLSKRTGLISELAAGGYIQAHDIQKLRPRQWINDEIVTFYTVLINQRSLEYESKSSSNNNNDEEIFLKVHCFSSFFMPKYDKEGYSGVKRWSKKVDLLSKDMIIFPINIGNAHWTCAAINLRAKRFEYFDSMGNRNPSVLANLRDYIVNEALVKKNLKLDISNWPDYHYKDLPQQNNSFDCGIFVCQFMDCLSRDWTFNNSNKDEKFNTFFDFDQSNMHYIRTKMVYEIVTKKFLDEEWN